MRKTVLAVLAMVMMGSLPAFAGALQDARLVNKGECGRNKSGMSVFVHNSNKRRAIKVTVNDTRRENGAKTNQYMLTKIIPAGADAAAGCSRDIVGDRIVENEFKIVVAVYE